MNDVANSASPDLLVRAQAITVRRGGEPILDGVDLAVSRREIVTLVGLNGAGKSTLVRALLGVIPIDGGEVWRRPRLRIGYAPQHLQRDGVLPIRVARFLSLGRRAPADEVAAVLGEVGAEALIERPLAGLSGGELQRVKLARALLRNPDLLVLDEPLAGVDMNGESELYTLIAGLRDRRDVGILLVSHDLHVVMAATDTVVCLNHHVCCTGHPRSVASHPAFVSLFGRGVAETLAVYAHHHDHEHAPDGAPIPLAGGADVPDGVPHPH